MSIEASLIASATQLLHERKYSNCLGVLEKLQAIGVYNRETAYMLAVSYLITGRYHRAFEIAEDMKKNWPDDNQANELFTFLQSDVCAEYNKTIESAYQLINAGHIRNAARILRKNIERAGFTVLPFKLLANAYLLLGKNTKARRCYDQALKIDASDPDAFSCLTATAVIQE